MLENDYSSNSLCTDESRHTHTHTHTQTHRACSQYVTYIPCLARSRPRDIPVVSAPRLWTLECRRRWAQFVRTRVQKEASRDSLPCTTTQFSLYIIIKVEITSNQIKSSTRIYCRRISPDIVSLYIVIVKTYPAQYIDIRSSVQQQSRHILSVHGPPAAQLHQRRPPELKKEIKYIKPLQSSWRIV